MGTRTLRSHRPPEIEVMLTIVDIRRGSWTSITRTLLLQSRSSLLWMQQIRTKYAKVRVPRTTIRGWERTIRLMTSKKKDYAKAVHHRRRPRRFWDVDDEENDECGERGCWCPNFGAANRLSNSLTVNIRIRQFVNMFSFYREAYLLEMSNS